MVTGLTILGIAMILFISAFVSYLDDKKEAIPFLLVAASVIALVGAMTIDSQLDRDCVQEVETGEIEGEEIEGATLILSTVSVSRMLSDWNMLNH